METPKKKKSLFPLVILLVVLLCTGAFAGVKYTENQVIKEVEELIATMPPELKGEASAVTYDIWDDILCIEDFKCVFSEEDVDFSIGKAIFKGISLDAFEAESGDYPLVAEEIILENILFDLKEDGKVSIESYVVKEWKQNLELLSKAAEQSIVAPEFLERAGVLEVGSARANAFKALLFLSEDKSETFEVNIAQINTSLKPTEASSRYSISFEGITNTIVTGGDTIDASMKNIVMENIRTMSPELISAFYLLTQNSFEEELLLDYLVLVQKEFLQSTLAEVVKIEDIAFSINKEEIFTFDAFSSSSTGSPLNVHYAINGFDITEELLNTWGATDESLPADQILTPLKLDAVKLDKEFTLTGSGDLQTLNLSLRTNENQLFDLQVALQANFPVPYLELYEEPLGVFASTGSNFLVKYIDKGFIARLVCALQEEDGISFEEAKEELLKLNQLGKVLFSPYAGLFDVLAQMIEKPGTLEIKIPEEVGMLNYSSLATNPEKFGIEYIYTPGDKTLKEIADAL